MANYNTLKSDIQAAIYQNGENAITGQILQEQLLSMVTSLGAGYQYGGVATPSTNPGEPDYKVFYLAGTEGTYTNFGGIVVANEVAILYGSGTSWTKADTGIKFVSVSQNSETGHIDITIGDTITPVASVGDIDDIVNAIGLEKEEITTEVGKDGYIVLYSSGALQNNPNAKVTKGITLMKGETIAFKCACYLTASALSKTQDSEGLTYPATPILEGQGTGDGDWYTYTAETDNEYLVICYITAVGLVVYKYSSRLENKVNSIPIVSKDNYSSSQSDAEALKIGNNIYNLKDHRISADLLDKIKSSDLLLQTEKTQQTITASIEGQFIQPNGAKGTYAPFNISTKVALKIGDVLCVTMRANNAVTAIGICTTSETLWEPAVAGVNSDSAIEYVYQATDDIEVQMSYVAEYGISGYIIHSDILDKIKSPKRVLLIGKDRNCDFDEIETALQSITDDGPNYCYTLLVLPGRYSRISVPDENRRVKYVNIIGVDREGCYVFDNSGNYDTPPFECLINGTIANMSFIMRSDDAHFNPRPSQGDDNYSYAMHSDYDYDRHTIFRNCYFESNTGPAVGLGIHQGVHLEFDDCKFIREAYKGIDLGALFAHTLANQDVWQILEFRNCVAINQQSPGNVGFYFTAVSGTVEGNYKLIVQNCWSGNANTGGAALGGMTIHYTSFGNNVANLNA